MLDVLTIAIASVRTAVPYAAGALGGTWSERGGVVNIAMEGLILSGAFTFVAVSYGVNAALGGTGSAVWLAPIAGLLAALVVGLILSAVHVLACVVFKADNIVSGLAINIFALGSTNFLLKRIFHSSSNSEKCPTFSQWNVFGAESGLAALNGLFHPIVLLLIAVFAGTHFLMFRTRFGLRVRAVGENPQAADSLGVSVGFYRAMCVLLGGAIASLGGVWLASETGLFVSNMSAGKGYIALAAMIVGKWRPWGVAAACLIFGGAETLQNHLQISQQAIPKQLFQALPYIITLIVIAGLVGRSTPPAAVGVPYEKERD